MGRPGNRVYPFHLGDINLATPGNIVEAMNQAIAEGKTGYCPAAGIAPLREALADDIGGGRGIALGADNIVVQPGGKPVITKFIQTLMNTGDGVLYPNPGYPIYESQIEYFGGTPLPYRYHETAGGFGIDLDQLRQLAPQARLPDLQRPPEPARVRELDGGDRRDRPHRRRARTLGPVRRGLLRDALLRHVDVDRLAARHGGTDRDPVHVLEEVRDDRVATRLCRRSTPCRRADRQAQHQ